MKFVMSYSIPIETQDKASARFVETGAAPPEGVTLLGRWHAVAGRRGWMVVEADDPSAVFRYSAMWRDVLNLDVTPVIEDQEAGAILASL